MYTQITKCNIFQNLCKLPISKKNCTFSNP